MRYIFLIQLLALISASYAAAPDDINSQQRGWFDAVDLNANNDYTDNPANNTAVSQWSDKSGSGNHLTQSGGKRPSYQLDSIALARHGLAFDGVDDELVDANDIWVGSVSNSESFIVATTDKVRNSFLFGSTDNRLNRLSAHTPWGNNQSYFDQGICCSAPARLYGSIPISLMQPYVWSFIGLPNLQSILQDSKLFLSDSSAGTYTVSGNSSFSLAGWPASPNRIHAGRYFEALFYQTALNNAQRSILQNYLSAKWDIALASGPTYSDVYAGDSAGNGDYDFFVGGIGQQAGQQTVATSQGLTITDIDFLSSDGKYVLAGVNYLVTSPLIGTTAADVPAGYSVRSNRSWYIDRTGSSGSVSLSFDAAELGIPVSNGSPYSLLHRSGTVGQFSDVATAVMAGGVVTFIHLPEDGVYTIGKKGTVALTLGKTSLTVKDPINLSFNPKSIPGSNTDYTLTVRNTGNGKPDPDTTIIKDTLPNELTLFTGDLNGSASPFIFTDGNCPPTTGAMTSHLTLDYPSDVIFKDVSGNIVIPSTDYDPTIRSFEITLSGTMNASTAGMIPCFTIDYRTRLD